MSNDKASSFRKRQLKTIGAQSDQNTSALKNLQQMAYSLAMKVFQMENDIRQLRNQADRATSIAKASEYRSLALSKLLTEKVVDEQILNIEIEQMQIEDFEENSRADDARRGLQAVDDQVAEKGLFAILTVRFFKSGEELKKEKIVRSKIEIGKEELFQGVDASVVGLKVGESRRFPLNIENQVDEAEVTLLGLRKAPPKAEPAETTPEKDSPVAITDDDSGAQS